MTDILGLLDPAQITLPQAAPAPNWLGHALGALVALGLILKAVWMRVGHRFRKDPARNARLESLREIEKLVDSPADEGFLLAAGRFIESWFGPTPPADVQSILAERDSRCFRQNRSSHTPLDPKTRRTMLSALRKSVLTLGFLVVFSVGGNQARAESPAELARTAYDAAKYDEAIEQWLKAGDYEALSSDVLYNIGNACYRAGSSGHAALYYRRALARDPGHQEARQNLRFIERKYGAITIRRPDFQYAIARIPLASWQTMLWAGLWLSGLAVLVFPATQPANRLRALAVIVLVFAPLVAAFGALGWRYFPTDAEFSPLSRQAVIVVKDAKLHAEASRTSPEVIDAPPGSLCEVIRESERWAYVAFASETRGWVPIEAIEKITPETTPTPPKIRKPKADGKSA
jgi:tetratricopeptide (TPR) repeat protein